MKTKTDLISIIEAAYAIDQPEEHWLHGILRAARSTIDDGVGLTAFTYDASDPRAFRFDTFLTEDMSPELAALARQGIPAADPDYIRQSFLAMACGTASEAPGWHNQPLVDRVMANGAQDMVTINGMNPQGQGCAVAALLRQHTKLTARRRNLLQNISCHMAAAYRLRLTLKDAGRAATASAEAVLDSAGKIHHLEGAARSRQSQSALIQSALTMVQARKRLRGSAAEQSVEEWKGLIAARWTLLEVSESDGRRYLVARQNQPSTAGPTALTDRERQVVALAGMGQHNKLIAYNLGISPSTVRVLFARAAAKLGLKGREQLIRTQRVSVSSQKKEKR